MRTVEDVRKEIEKKIGQPKWLYQDGESYLNPAYDDVLEQRVLELEGERELYKNTIRIVSDGIRLSIIALNDGMSKADIIKHLKGLIKE